MKIATERGAWLDRMLTRVAIVTLAGCAAVGCANSEQLDVDGGHAGSGGHGGSVGTGGVTGGAGSGGHAGTTGAAGRA